MRVSPAGVAEIALAYEEHQAWPSEVTGAAARYFLSTLPGSPRRCLFLGAATGANDALPFARIADPRDRILAGDIESGFLDRLRARAADEGIRNVEARLLDVTTDLSPLGEFDLITLLFVIHRLKSWESVVDRLGRLVSPGGSFFISEFAGPSGVIYLSNERGGEGSDPVSRVIRRYFELLPERFAPPLKSTCIGPVLERLGTDLKPMGHRDFIWRQRVTARGMFQKIEERAYAPFFSTHPAPAVLGPLRDEFATEMDRPVPLEETIRIYRFGRPKDVT